MHYRSDCLHFRGHVPCALHKREGVHCDLIVSAVTMAMHLALGLGKKLVLLNNIFNRHEFELYGRGVIVEPQQPCNCFFQPRCTQERFCLETLAPASVRAAVRSLLETR